MKKLVISISLALSLFSCSTEEEDYSEYVSKPCECLRFKKVITLVDPVKNIWVEEYPNPEGFIVCDAIDTNGAYIYTGTNAPNVVYGNGVLLKEFYEKIECPK